MTFHGLIRAGRTRLIRRMTAAASWPRRAQLRTRVLAGVLAVTLVALAAFDIAAVTALRRYLLNRADAQLQTVLTLYRPLNLPASWAQIPVPGGRFSKVQKRTAGPVRAKAGGPRFVIIGPRLLLPAVLGQYYVVSVPDRGHGQPRAFVRGNPDLRPALPGDLPALAASRQAQTVTSLNGRAQLRLLAVPAGGGHALVVTTSMAGINKTAGQLELIVAIGSAAAALLVFLGVGLIARRGLRPIETMAAAADKITAGDLTDRVSPQDSSTEVGRLGTALNGMLARIEAAVAEREASQELTRRFFADASHELRNPLASLRANAELYQQGALPRRAQVDQAINRIASEAQRMSTLVDDMLRLARLDQHPGQHHDPVNLTALITECAQRAQLTGPRHTWRAHPPAGLQAAGDEELLRRAIDNVLANITAHTPPGTTATITAARHPGTITIDITDNGPGIPPADLPRIFDRFYRAGAPAHRPGSGLGLAVVTAIAAAHHGTATAAASTPHGLTITLTLPASARTCPARSPGPAARLVPRTPRDPAAS